MFVARSEPWQVPILSVRCVLSVSPTECHALQCATSDTDSCSHCLLRSTRNLWVCRVGSFPQDSNSSVGFTLDSWAAAFDAPFSNISVGYASETENTFCTSDIFFPIFYNLAFPCCRRRMCGNQNELNRCKIYSLFLKKKKCSHWCHLL